MGKYLIRIIHDNVSVYLHGKRLVLHNGDWIEVGRIAATSLVAENKAEMIDTSGLLESDNLQVMVAGDPAQTDLFFKEVPIVRQSKTIKKPTLVLDKSYNFKDKEAPGILRNPALFALVFDYAQKFDICVAVENYKTTVETSGRELQATGAIVKDTRVLMLQSHAVVFSGSKPSQKVYAEWQSEKANGEVHALLRAIHKVKPTIYYMPPHWGIQK